MIGAVASGLCLIHCLATPFLFIAKACTDVCCADTPVWWQAVDYVFLVISFIAIYFASKSSTTEWVEIALWSSWCLLMLAVLDESFQMGLFPESFIYAPALSIVGLHLYNQKYCKCTEDSCCITE